MSKLNVDSTILIVDDSGFARANLAGSIKKMGFRNVREMSTAEEALESLRLSAQVGLVLCDQKMTGMSGTEFLHKFRRNQDWNPIPFVLVTAHVSPAVVAELADYGGDAVVVKPFSPQTLEDKINEAIRSRWFHMGLTVEEAEQTIQQIKGDLSGKRAYVFQTQTRLGPKDPKTTYAKGIKAEKDGERDRAEKYFLEVLGAQPHFLKARESLADLYLAKGETDKALEHLQIAVTINPGNFQRRYDLAKMLMDQGQIDDAGKVLAEMLADGCRYPELLMRVGKALRDLGREEDAARAFNCSIENEPDNTEAYEILEDMHRRKGDGKKLLAVLEAAALAMPRSLETQWRCARALIEAKRPKEALTAAKKVLALDENHKGAIELLDKYLSA